MDDCESLRCDAAGSGWFVFSITELYGILQGVRFSVSLIYKKDSRRMASPVLRTTHLRYHHESNDDERIGCLGASTNASRRHGSRGQADGRLVKLEREPRVAWTTMAVSRI